MSDDVKARFDRIEVAPSATHEKLQQVLERGTKLRRRSHLVVGGAVIVLLIGGSVAAQVVTRPRAPVNLPVASPTPDPDPSSGSDGTRRFDRLTLRLELAASSVDAGASIRSTLVIENRSGRSVTDPRCWLIAGRYGLAPVDDPGAELLTEKIVNCGGPMEYEDGFRDHYDGPTFVARTTSGDPLAPGEYLASLKIRGRSDRLQQPILVTATKARLHPPATGPVKTVATGKVEGQRWRLTAYRSKEGLCVDLHFGTNSWGGCGFRSGGELMVAGIGWGMDLPHLAQLDGHVSERVATLTVRSGGNRPKPVLLHPARSFDRIFFVLFVPLDQRAVLVARDASGEILKRRVFTPAELNPQA